LAAEASVAEVVVLVAAVPREGGDHGA